MSKTLSEGLHARQKQQILSASGNALKILENKSDIRISFLQRHRINNRATPMNFAKYKLAIQLFKIYNGTDTSDDWLDMNVQQNFSSRSNMFQINDYSNIRIGKNMISNRLNVLNNQISLGWLNQSLISYKLKLKELFLNNN